MHDRAMTHCSSVRLQHVLQGFNWFNRRSAVAEEQAQLQAQAAARASAEQSAAARKPEFATDNRPNPDAVPASGFSWFNRRGAVAEGQAQLQAQAAARASAERSAAARKPDLATDNRPTAAAVPASDPARSPLRWLGRSPRTKAEAQLEAQARARRCGFTPVSLVPSQVLSCLCSCPELSMCTSGFPPC